MENFTEKQLVEFGNYLLSEERMKLFVGHPGFDGSFEDMVDRMRGVHDSDIANFLNKQK